MVKKKHLSNIYLCIIFASFEKRSICGGLGVFVCLFGWIFVFVGVGFYKMTVKWTLKTILVACVNLMTVLEILSLIGFLRGSAVFPEFFPDCRSCLFGEIQVLRPKLGVLFCFGDMSLCSSGNSFAEGMSQSRVPAPGLH